MTRIVPKRHLQCDFQDKRTTKARILDAKSAYRQNRTESWSYITMCTPNVPITLPAPGGEPGPKTYVRPDERGLLLAAYGRGRIHACKGVSQRPLEQDF